MLPAPSPATKRHQQPDPRLHPLSRRKFHNRRCPGAGTELGTGTSLGVLNSTGEAAGIAIDDSFLSHPFIRDPFGKFTSWGIPGSASIDVIALNDLGAVVGQWFDSSSLPHAYQRTPLGIITSFSVPVPNTGATPMATSNRGRIAGIYSDLRSVNHGFVR
jgi:hypothetical protein